MPKTPEGEVRKWFIAGLKKEFGKSIYVQINHQSRYTSRGIPDITICVNGIVLWVELKAKGNSLSSLQWVKRNEIITAGGTSTYIVGKDVQKLSKIVRYIRYKIKCRRGGTLDTT